MVVPAEVLSIFNDKSYEVVMDVGGDENGAIALGQYNKYFNEEPYDMYFVINNNRPFTPDALSTEEYLHDIERTSRLKVTHFISNTNMSYETTAEDILKGDKETMELSQKLNIPYKYAAVKRDLAQDMEGKLHAEILPVDIYMKPPWR